MPEDLTPSALWAEYSPYILGFGLKVLGALVVLIIGLRIAGWLSGTVRKEALKREGIDDTLGNFFSSLVRWGLMAAVFIAVLQVFGVQATSFVAVLGALTLAIGLSMQGALGNIASGVMIMLFRPYKLGDYIEAAGVGGTVKDINLFQTVLATPDNVKILMPNSQAIDGVIENYSGYDTRRADVTFGIDYDDDMDKAIDIIKSVIEADARILSDPEPFVKVVNLGDSSVDIASRSWVKADDYWDVKFHLTKAVKEAFDREGISIPYPHQVEIQKKAAND
ncbi:mechanosensitive ion channel family protein [Hyphomonas pacifica]|uniref:Small-conductance mechanosensitive channel n=1 Tax=Hyphomonas pacifica TaxID=1280941 RepID=A0A062U0Z8_9PROT|nr:mechanosensitive ion channel domain-containing protein [Hyphomonas pacifica]KCZ48434.1 mechanosensitive ion channel protein MscS [Hyphomonas pacifica]RAN31746.1 mechanosensitive ion channel protein MscS [Hyphomonas pacifica]